MQLPTSTTSNAALPPTPEHTGVAPYNVTRGNNVLGRTRERPVGVQCVDDLTEALQRVQLAWQRGYLCWVSFQILADKVERKALELAEQFGTGLQPWQKQDRKARGLPTAMAVCLRVMGNPARREIILMATPLVRVADSRSPWVREKWFDCLPEVGCFVMVREPRDRGDSAWTWRLQEQVYHRLVRDLTAEVKRGNSLGVERLCAAWMHQFPMVGGVRRQFRRLFHSGSKLWAACHRSAWPGADPDQLPMQIGFRGTPRLQSRLCVTLNPLSRNDFRVNSDVQTSRE